MEVVLNLVDICKYFGSKKIIVNFSMKFKKVR